LGVVELVFDPKDCFLRNGEYAPELIRYDSQYCTSVSSLGVLYSIPTLAYIDQVLDFVREDPVVIDIGCGQGELVFQLRNRSIDAWGFDPVVRTINPYLHSRLWEPSDKVGDLYVMRCVLPHIQNPWDFLEQISNSSPNALVLVEFQRVEWILEHKVWYQISHDHVNLFSINDFVNKFEVLQSGTFSNGEWGWVLVNPTKQKDQLENFSSTYQQGLSDLFREKDLFLGHLKIMERPIALWGAAGKGIVLAHAMQEVQEHLYAIDADSHRWGLYLEASGVEVIEPNLALERAVKETLILVCNPNHIDQVKSFVGNRFEVRIPTEISKRG